MTTSADDPLRASLESWIGKPMSSGGPAYAPDPVNLPMIRHWVDALDDHDPVYLDEAKARASRFGGLVAPPAMLQTWTMGRPRLEGIAERGGSSSEMDPGSPFVALAKAGLSGTLATNSELEFLRYLRIGDLLHSSSALESISERKTTGLGSGYFVTWMTSYFAGESELVGRQRFRIFKFAPGGAAAKAAGDGEAHSSEAVRHRIKTMIDAETPATVLSDDSCSSWKRTNPSRAFCVVNGFCGGVGAGGKNVWHGAAAAMSKAATRALLRIWRPLTGSFAGPSEVGRSGARGERYSPSPPSWCRRQVRRMVLPLARMTSG